MVSLVLAWIGGLTVLVVGVRVVVSVVELARDARRRLRLYDAAMDAAPDARWAGASETQQAVAAYQALRAGEAGVR